MRSAKVFFKDAFAGTLRETESGYEFAYDETYLRADTAEPVSLTLPLRAEPYVQRTFFFVFRRAYSRRLAARFCHANLEARPARQNGVIARLLQRLHRRGEHHREGGR